MVEVRRDTVIVGRFRMESDNPSAEWPPQIGVNAFLAFDGKPLLNGTVAKGAAEGQFVLRNAFGPRVLRCGPYARTRLPVVAIPRHPRGQGHYERAD